MKRTVILNAMVLDKASAFMGKKVDIIIEAGKVLEIGENLKDKTNSSDELIDAKVQYITTGWVDLQANFCDPGLEYKEDLISGASSAQKGGFTRVCLSPLTTPVSDTKAQVEYITTRAEKLPIHLNPLSCISVKAKGENLAELYDLHLAGAIAFTDGKQELTSKLLLKTLQYTQQFKGLVITYPNNHSLTTGGQVNEGKHSVNTGLKGIPAFAEETQLAHYLDILRYTGGKLHVHAISTADAVKLLKKAKEEGLNVTADICAYQLAFDDSVVESFESKYKVFPPFRSKEDISYVIKALKEGIIDAVCSNHEPRDTEEKNLEFDLAEFGINGIQTAYSIVNTQLSPIAPAADIVALFNNNPRKILGLPASTIKVGEEAEFTFFNPELEWTFTEEMNASKSKNTPFFNHTFKGKAVATFVKGRYIEILD
jgi:dihydroorotase